MVTEKGYDRVWREGKRVYLHKWVWEKTFGPLPADWDIHHIDGNKRGPHLVAMPKEDHVNLHSGKTVKL